MENKPRAIGAGLVRFEKTLNQSANAPGIEIENDVQLLDWMDAYRRLKSGDTPEDNPGIPANDHEMFLRHQLLSHWLETDSKPNFSNINEKLLRHLNNDFLFFEFFCEVMRGYIEALGIME